MITMYGISNCSTVKKAKDWLDAAGIEYTFHDYRKDGITEAQLSRWEKELGWEALLNKRGTTWRKLPESDTSDVDAAKAIQLMLAHPAMIKRPLLDTGSTRLLGFKADVYEQTFK